MGTMLEMTTSAAQEVAANGVKGGFGRVYRVGLVGVNCGVVCRVKGGLTIVLGLKEMKRLLY